jgi:hypothetical protein
MAKTKNTRAVVFLRSASGKSLLDLRDGMLPPDLAEYRAPAEAMGKVRRGFQDLGFRVFTDDRNLNLFLSGPPSLFAAVFNVSEETFRSFSGIAAHELRPPEELSGLIEKITLLREPTSI